MSAHHHLALVVEDDHDIGTLLRRHLARAGLAVRVASTGEEALAVLATEPADVLLLDLQLPGIDGAEVLRRIRRDQRLADTPVLVISILEPGDTADLAVDGWLVKPFSGVDVVREVRRLLSDRHHPTDAVLT